MYITNIWGIFFMFYVPTIISIVLAYLEGKEDRKKKRRKKVNG